MGKSKKINQAKEECVKDIVFCAVGNWSLYRDYGKTVFLTREEAEAALKGGADK